MTTSTMITRKYGTFRCIFRDHTQEGERGFLGGHAIDVRLFFVSDLLSRKELEHYISTKSGWIDQYLHELLSNTVLVSTKDPLANVIVILERENMIDVRVMRDVTLTGLRSMFLEDFSLTLREQTEDKIKLSDIEVCEAYVS